MFQTENDRKANIDVLEANKNSNKDDIKKMREDNKDLRQKLAQLQKVGGVTCVSNNVVKRVILFIYILESFNDVKYPVSLHPRYDFTDNSIRGVQGRTKAFGARNREAAQDQ